MFVFCRGALIAWTTLIPSRREKRKRICLVYESRVENVLVVILVVIATVSACAKAVGKGELAPWRTSRLVRWLGALWQWPASTRIPVCQGSSNGRAGQAGLDEGTLLIERSVAFILKTRGIPYSQESHILCKKVCQTNLQQHCRWEIAAASHKLAS